MVLMRRYVHKIMLNWNIIVIFTLIIGTLFCCQKLQNDHINEFRTLYNKLGCQISSQGAGLPDSPGLPDQPFYADLWL